MISVKCTWSFRALLAGLVVVLSSPQSVDAQLPGATYDPVTMDPPIRDTVNRASREELAFTSHGSRLNGLMYTAQGAGPHPTVILLHGYPGVERNLDLAQAIRRAGTTDVDKVAAALEGAEFTTIGGDQVVMRREDHQLQMPIYISVHTNKNIKHDLDASGFGLSLENTIERDKVVQPSTCKMQRPS